MILKTDQNEVTRVYYMYR